MCTSPSSSALAFHPSCDMDCATWRPIFVASYMGRPKVKGGIRKRQLMLPRFESLWAAKRARASQCSRTILRGIWAAKAFSRHEAGVMEDASVDVDEPPPRVAGAPYREIWRSSNIFD